MTPLLIASLTGLMVATSFLSGIFGMAGGLVLMGVLLFILPLPEAMALHAITQMASNGWRGTLWVKHANWKQIGIYIAGSGVAIALWMVWRYVPSTPLALIFLGASPFITYLLPGSLQPNPNKLTHGIAYGSVCMTLMLLTGGTGPLIDRYFLGGTSDRKQVVATKAIAQAFGHGVKLFYFGSVVDQAASVHPVMGALAVIASIAGTSLAKPVLERLSDQDFRLWANRIILTIACFYLTRGFYLLLAG